MKSHLYTLEGEFWSEQQILVPNDVNNSDYINTPVALSGNQILVGARNDDDVDFNSGNAYFYDLSSRVDHQPIPLMFEEPFPTVPLLFAEMQTFNGRDPASVRINEISTEGFTVLVEEEQSKDDETDHYFEKIGFFTLEPGDLFNSEGDIIGEAGVVSHYQEKRETEVRLTLSRSYSNPVVIMKMNTAVGKQPAHVRLRKVAENSFTFKVEEWDYHNGIHVEEELAYVVVEAGKHTMSDGRTLFATQAVTDHNFVSVSFEGAFEGKMPVVVSQSQEIVGGSAVVTRQKNVTSDSFEVSLQEEENPIADSTSHADEPIGIIAVAE